jgi:hypothetical protein
MAATLPDLGTGATLSVAGLGWTTLEIISFSLSFTREAVDISHTGITVGPAAVRKAIPSRLGTVRISLEVNWMPDNNPTEVGEADNTITFTFPKQAGGAAAGAKWIGTGNVAGVTVQGGVDAKMTASMEVVINSGFSFVAET